MSHSSLMYWQEQFHKGVPRLDRFVWQITGAAAAKLVVAQSAVLHGFGAITQAAIDAHLGSTDEFDGDAFDATAMGADVFAAIFNYRGQVSKLVQVVARCYSGTAGATLVEQSVLAGTLTASTVETAAEVSSDGNVAVKVNFGNTPDFDALTSGIIAVDLLWVSK